MTLINLSDGIDSDKTERIIALLASGQLPMEDFKTLIWLSAWGVDLEERLFAFGGIERCGEVGLLRSIVVDEPYRGQGLGGQLVERLHQDARNQGLSELYLLTNDAADYFGRYFGYQTWDRSEAPRSIIRSNQFSCLCPDTAILMRLAL